MRSESGPARIRAFTLIEVCVVVAILFLLVLVLIPAFRKSEPLRLAPEAAPTTAAATPQPVPPIETAPAAGAPAAAGEAEP